MALFYWTQNGYKTEEKQRAILGQNKGGKHIEEEERKGSERLGVCFETKEPQFVDLTERKGRKEIEFRER